MEILEQHPMDKMVMPRAERHEAVFYKEDELNELFRVFEGHKLELIVHIAAYYGLRRCEFLGLKWDSIDFRKGTITIERKVVSDYDESGQAKLFVETRLKTNSTRRTLPLIPHIEEMLLKKQEMDKHYKKLGGKKEAPAYTDEPVPKKSDSRKMKNDTIAESSQAAAVSLYNIL